MTVTKTTRRTADVRPLPRRAPVPASEPRYDDQRGGRLVSDAPTQGALALDLAPTHAPVVGRGSSGGHLRLVEQPTAPVEDRRTPEDDENEDTFFARQRTSRTELPDPKSWSGRYVQSLVEVLSGSRPAAQLLRWTHEGVYADVVRRVAVLARTTTASTRGSGSGGRAVVKSVHVCEPSDGIAEASVHVRHGARSRAIAVRLEGLDGRWRCTALQLG